ncbi:unnamed protein product [Albugo candida]|uniref:PH domain-containing protein n=1 Tax=Albugo candida TaxID=65357 RepID=A0A024GBR9_9STRA|nr:unnamed protein product [Albugo candida]|eukprot:CCI44114.1 unnamed protein product [Albugo candida]
MATSEEFAILKQGYLHKQSRHLKVWKIRYFSLTRTHLLYSKRSGKAPKAAILLKEVQVHEDQNKVLHPGNFVFEVQTATEHRYYLSAATELERIAWLTEIRASQSHHTCIVNNSNISFESAHTWSTVIKGDTRKQRNKLSKTRKEERKRVKLRRMSKSFTDTWIEDILPRPMPSDIKSVVALCFAGIPKELRGRVWGWLLGNKLQINEELFRICKDRAKAVRSEIALQKEVDAIMKLSAGPSTLATQSTNFSEDESDDAKVSPSTTRLSTPCLTTSENEDIDLVKLSAPSKTLQNLAGVAEKLVATCERSVWLVDVDIHRTFAYHPMFQEGGHGAERTREVLHAYICYRPDLGYVQGFALHHSRVSNER